MLRNLRPLRAALALLLWGSLIPHESWAQFRDVTHVENPAVLQNSDAFKSKPPEPAAAPPATESPEDRSAPAPAREDSRPLVSESDDGGAPNSASQEPWTPVDEEEPAARQFTIDELEQMVEEEPWSEADGDDLGHRSMRFRGVTVGRTNLEELLAEWGKPYKIVRSADSRIIKYRVEPFRQVDVTVIGDRVVSILVYLNDLLEPGHVSKQIQLTSIEPVPIPDEYGKVMGLAFPERGVLYSFDPRYPELLVSKIQLEQVNPEPFLLRAEYDFDRRYEQNLADIDTALKMSPKYARAHWLRAEKLAELGRFQEALEAADKADHYDPGNVLYRLTRTYLMARSGNHDSALRDVGQVLQRVDLLPEHRAFAELIVGDLIAESAGARYKEALEHHLKAIELAAPLANDRRFVVRRLAKTILIRSHLSVARDISLGEFENQPEVVRKWVERSFALVEESLDRDQGDKALLLDVYYHTFATAADLRSEDNAGPLVQELLDEARTQIQAAPDARSKSRLEWKLGAALAEAVRLERQHGNEEFALDIADDALVLLQQSAKSRQATPDQRYLVGRLYFHVGSLHAVQREDHEEAVAWYRKAEPLLAGEVPPGVLADPGTHGEMFVSMGVSYWELGDREKAIDLTEMGTDVLQRAVVDGSIQPISLSIPYGNLATMHKNAGNESDAKAFAELAKSLDEKTTVR